VKNIISIVAALLLTLPAWTVAAAQDGDHAKAVAVLPFVVHDVENGESVARAISEIFALPLSEDSGRIRLIAPDSTAGILKDKAGADLSLDEIYMLGRSMGADYVIYGTVNPVGRSLGISVELIDIPGYLRKSTLNAVCHGMAEAESRLSAYARRLEAIIDEGGQ
jgi:TolB-like protein